MPPNNNQTKIEGVAKPNVMVALRCFTDTKLLWQYAKICITLAIDGRLGVQFNDTATLPDP